MTYERDDHQGEPLIWFDVRKVMRLAEYGTSDIEWRTVLQITMRGVTMRHVHGYRLGEEIALFYRVRA